MSGKSIQSQSTTTKGSCGLILDFGLSMMVILLVYHTGMCIKGPKSWWITKSITPQLVVNQSKVNPQRPKGVVDWFWIDLPRVEEL